MTKEAWEALSPFEKEVLDLLTAIKKAIREGLDD